MGNRALLQEVLGLAGDFVTRQDGVWNHADWELLLSRAAALGIDMDDESKRALGNLIESAKLFYCMDSKCGAASCAKPTSAKARGKATR